MRTLTVNIDNNLSEKAITAVLDALKLEYEIDDTAQITQGRKDMEAGKGTKIPIEDLWK